MFVALSSEMYYASRFVNAYETARVGVARAGTLQSRKKKNSNNFTSLPD